MNVVKTLILVLVIFFSGKSSNAVKHILLDL